MRHRKSSFKKTVLIPVITVCIISAFIITTINYRLLASTVNIKINANLDIYTDSILTHIKHLEIILDATKQTLNEKHIAIVKSLAYALNDTNMTPEELQRLAEPLDILEINIVDSNGIVTGSTIPENIGFDYKSTEFTSAYLPLADGTLTELYEEPRFSVLADGSEDGNIHHYTGVSRAGGGFIQAGFNADVIGRLQDEIDVEMAIQNTKLGDNGYGIVLIDRRISAHPDETMIGLDVSGEDWYKAISSGSGYVWIDIAGEPYYAGYRNENGSNVVGLVPESDFYRELNKALAATFLVLLVAIFVMTVCVYLLLDKLLLPIKRLSEGLEEIAKGDLNVRIEGDYHNEFDEIKDAVNSMAEGIQTHLMVMSGIEYARKIQNSLLPPVSAFQEAFSDFHIIWEPKEIVGGDIYWIKNFDEGAVLCVCDCTGHGTPGALLTMLVVSTFETSVNDNNYKDTAGIIWELEKRLVTVLHVEKPKHGSRGLSVNDGCDLAVLYVAAGGSVTLSSGNMNVFVCDGKSVTRFRGQRLRVGGGTLQSKNDIKTITISADPHNKFYIASDGLYEQIGGENHIPFGYEPMEKLILQNHEETQDIISGKIWQAFLNYSENNARLDDFELITFKPRMK